MDHVGIDVHKKESRSAWALAGGRVALTLARVIASYVLHPYRPRLRRSPGARTPVFSTKRTRFPWAATAVMIS